MFNTNLDIIKIIVSIIISIITYFLGKRNNKKSIQRIINHQEELVQKIEDARIKNVMRSIWYEFTMNRNFLKNIYNRYIEESITDKETYIYIHAIRDLFCTNMYKLNITDLIRNGNLYCDLQLLYTSDELYELINITTIPSDYNLIQIMDTIIVKMDNIFKKYQELESQMFDPEK